jgi:hypothetical protein
MEHVQGTCGRQCTGAQALDIRTETLTLEAGFHQEQIDILVAGESRDTL